MKSKIKMSLKKNNVKNSLLNPLISLKIRKQKKF